jgi:hypothetical protein
MRRLLTLALCFFALSAQAATPAPYTAEYEVRRNGEPMGTAKVSFKALGRGQYELRTHTTGTSGLAALTGVDIDERSLIDWREPQPETQSYSYQQRVAWKAKQRRIDVDARGGRIDSRDGDKSYAPPYEPGVLDRHAITVALMRDLAAGERDYFIYRVPQRDAIETQRYRVTGRERLSTALGPQTAARVERQRESGGGRQTTLWFGTDQGFIPMRMLQTEPDGETVEMRIVSIR